ncbi:MAG: hypothetical protein ABIH23_30765 [bacterium]
MNPQIADDQQQLVQKLPPLLLDYVRQHGIPKGMLLEEAMTLTEEEQRELIETLDALAESQEKKTTPLRQFMAENDL